MTSSTEQKQQESQVPAVAETQILAQRVQQIRNYSTALIHTLVTSVKEIEPLLKYERGLDMKRAIKGTAISAHVKIQGEPAVMAALDIQITRLAASINVKHNLTSMQIRQMVSDVLEKYKHESIEDILLVFKRARQGDFSKKQPIYQLDQQTIFGWIDQHMEEKSIERERMYDQWKNRSGNEDKQLLNDDQLEELYENARKGLLSDYKVIERRNDENYEEFKSRYIAESMARRIAEPQLDEKIKLLNRAEQHGNQTETRDAGDQPGNSDSSNSGNEQAGTQTEIHSVHQRPEESPQSGTE